ncbi:hypothetical protein LX32DRAFT_638062 [Colletotrichum zoysiae]|uniref:Uncharacterized protein n=1 Tax=Colletotrichum zoysiae TaxID=1216348 RepID=A0AAD9HJY2_9PEZI|nr:hypothetical protein LX32DRAFT_638062 [Colletotrichum zoysiae]
MRSITSSLLAAVLLAAAPAAAVDQPPPFSQEYNLVDTTPCVLQPNNTYTCSDGDAFLNFYGKNFTEAYYFRIENQTSQLGVKLQCGGPDAFTLFAAPGISATSFTLTPCEGKELTSVTLVEPKSSFKIPYFGEELSFTDADPCTPDANGGFSCGGGSTIAAAGGAINMTLPAGAGDSAIRAFCMMGNSTVSSVFFVSSGGQGLFNTPSVCGNGITKAVNVRSRTTLWNPNSDNCPSCNT